MIRTASGFGVKIDPDYDPAPDADPGRCRM